jgi:hypothetical protein
MENIKKLSDNELSEYFDLVSRINEVMETYSHIPLPLTVTNALWSFELKLEKEYTRREL